MTDPFTVDAGARYAFAPSPQPIEGTLHRIRIVFEASPVRVWSAGTDMMAPEMDSAEDFCGALNAQIGLDRDAWMALAERVADTRQRAAHLGTEDTLTPKRAATERIGSPARWARTTRSRRSFE